MKRTVVTFDPIVNLSDVIINGRYVFSQRFLRALLGREEIDEVVVFGERIGNRIGAQSANLGDFLDGRLRLFDMDEAPRLLPELDILAVHSSMDKGLLTHLAQVRRFLDTPGPPLTATVHSVGYPVYMPHLLAMFHVDVRSHDALFCPSPSVKTSLETIFGHLAPEEGTPPARLKIIPHGVDTEVFRPRPAEEARFRLELPLDRPVLLFVGRLSPVNKLDFGPVLRALAPLWQEEAERPLLCIVATEETAYSRSVVEQAGELGIDLRIVYDRREEELAQYYNAADIFLGLSDTICEMFGLTVLEAMASGTAVVATEVGGYRDLIRDEENGLLIPTFIADCLELPSRLSPLRDDGETMVRINAATAIDLDALLSACRRLLDEPGLRRRLGEAAREDVIAGYAWEPVMDRTIACWEELNQRRAAPSVASSGGPVDIGLPYFEAFGSFFSHIVGDEAQFKSRLEPGQDFIDISLPGLNVPGFIDMSLLDWVLTREGVWSLRSLRDMSSLPTPIASGELERTVMWAFKEGLIELIKL